MLKNNKERQAYVLDDSNWELYNPQIRCKKLKGTNLIRIEAVRTDEYMGNRWVALGVYEFRPDDSLDNVYNLSNGAIIEIIKRTKENHRQLRFDLRRNSE